MKRLHLAILLIGVFLVFFLYHLYFLPYGISMLGEGYYAYGAKEVMEGKVLFKDIVSYGHAPGQFYLLGLFMKVFGYNLFVERMYYLIAGSFLVIILFLITYNLTKKIFPSLFVSLLFTFFMPLKSERLLFPYLAIFLAIASDMFNPEDKAKRYWSFAVGLVIGSSLMISQEFAVSAGIGLLALLIYRAVFKKEIRNSASLMNLVYQISIFIMGVLAVVLPVLYFFYKSDAIKQLLYYMVYYPLTVYPKTMGYPFPDIAVYFKSFILSPSLRSLYYFVNTSFLYFSIFISVFVYALTIAKFKEASKNHADYGALVLLIFGLVCMIKLLPRPELPGVLQTIMIPTAILGSFLLNEIYKRFKKPNTKRVFVFFCVLILVFFVTYGQVVINPTLSAQESNFLILKNKAQYGKLNLEGAKDIYSRTIPAEDISNTVLFIQNNTIKGDYIFAVPYESMFYFLSERDNPTEYNQFLPGTHDENDQLQVIEVLKKTKPKLIIYGHGWAIYNKPFEQYAPLIHNYIKDNYVLRKTFGIYEIYSPS